MKVLPHRAYKVLRVRPGRYAAVTNRDIVCIWTVLRVKVVVVCLQDITAQIETGKQPLGARVGEKLRLQQHIGRRLRVTTDRTRRRRCVRAQLYLAVQHVLDALVVHP